MMRKQTTTLITTGIRLILLVSAVTFVLVNRFDLEDVPIAFSIFLTTIYYLGPLTAWLFTFFLLFHFAVVTAILVKPRLSSRFGTVKQHLLSLGSIARIFVLCHIFSSRMY
jgi:hypothetical protein